MQHVQNPPELPKLQVVPQQAPSPTPTSSTPMKKGGGGQGQGGRSLRHVVGLVSGGGFAILVGVLALEYVAKEDLRPSVLLARFEASREMTEYNTKMGDSPNRRVRMTEAEYQAALAEATRAGQARAELDYQRDLAVLQADVDRVKTAYTTLYERANQIAAITVQMEAALQQARQALAQQGMQGRVGVSILKDYWCALAGDQTACESARRDRADMNGELNALATNTAGDRIHELFQGIEDPASLVVHTDLARNGAPTIQRSAE